MNTDALLQTAESLLTPFAAQTNAPEPGRLDFTIPTGDELHRAIQALQRAGWGYLAAITGLDLGLEDGRFEILYHFCEGAAVITLRLAVSRDSAVIPTVCTLIPSAGFFERELGEMFGVTILDAPNTDHLFLPDEWPEGVYPLRKDFQTSG
jgi:Ni,Fe-hydrogenase III component G